MTEYYNLLGNLKFLPIVLPPACYSNDELEKKLVPNKIYTEKNMNNSEIKLDHTSDRVQIYLESGKVISGPRGSFGGGFVAYCEG